MKTRGFGVAATLIVGATTAIYLSRLDAVAGMMVDDAWYVVLAKALASGSGYGLISSATVPLLPAVPPGFPLLLAPVFLLPSGFPDNLVLLKALSIVAMAGVGVVCWIDFTRNRGVTDEAALVLVAVVVLTPAFVFLATSTVMAECLFTLVQLLAVVLVERVTRQPPGHTRAAVLAGIALAATLLIRTAGIASLAAAVVFLAWRGRWRELTICALTVAACALPWQLYARAHAPSADQRFAHGGTIAYSYQQLIAMARPGSVSSAVTSREIVSRGADNIGGIFTRDVGAILAPELFRGAAESGQEVVAVGGPGLGSMGAANGTMVVSVLLSLMVVIGIVRSGGWFSMPALLIVASIAMLATVGALTYRYMLPLTPFLVLFSWKSLPNQRVARIAAVSVLGLHLMDHARYLGAKFNGTSDWVNDAREVDQVLVALSQQPPGAVASSNPGLIYLRTGRKGVALAFPEENRAVWATAGVRYAVALRPMERPRGGELVFQTERGLWIVKM